jgi:hypothetical protein
MKENRPARCLYQLVQHWWWVVWPAVIAGGFALLCWLMSIWIGGMKEGGTAWWDRIEDPTERGCSYIATAIVAHAAVMAFKTLSHDRIKVKLEK